MGQDIKWVIDAEEREAWEAERTRIKQELDPLVASWWELFAKYEEIEERGLARNPGEGLRYAIITPDEGKELERLKSELESVAKRMDVVVRRMVAHVALFPRLRPRQVED